MPSSAAVYGLSDPGLLFVLMALPPVTYEHRFGLGDPSSVADFRKLVPARREPAHTQMTLNSKLL
jgi:hypothetical protein